MNTLLNKDIRTAYDAPPIPTRAFDYAAWVDGEEEWLTGYGATAAAAIADLTEQIEEYFYCEEEAA